MLGLQVCTVTWPHNDILELLLVYRSLSLLLLHPSLSSQCGVYACEPNGLSGLVASMVWVLGIDISRTSMLSSASPKKQTDKKTQQCLLIPLCSPLLFSPKYI